MTQMTEGRASPVGPILAIGGGAIVAIGSFWAWFTLSAPGFSDSGSGIGVGDGWITLAAGVLMMIAGLVTLAGRRILTIRDDLVRPVRYSLSPSAVRGMAILAIVNGSS